MQSDPHAVVSLAASVLERQHRDGRSCILCPGRCVRLSRGCGGCSILADFAGALVVPERPTAEKQEKREDRELGGADALLTSVAVVPGQDEHDRQPDDEREQGDLPHLLWPVEGLADVLEALQEPPGGRDLDKSPLDDLAAAKSIPDAFVRVRSRGVGHVLAALVWVGHSGSFILRRYAMKRGSSARPSSTGSPNISIRAASLWSYARSSHSIARS